MTDKKETTSTAPVEAKKEETKAEKFIRLADARMGKALDAIASLRGLTAKNNYEYTPVQWLAIFKALEAEMVKLQNAVKSPNATEEKGFSLAAAVAEVEPKAEEKTA